MNNLLSHCGLVNVRINASDKDLPVKTNISCRFCNKTFQVVKTNYVNCIKITHQCNFSSTISWNFFGAFLVCIIFAILALHTLKGKQKERYKYRVLEIKGLRPFLLNCGQSKLGGYVPQRVSKQHARTPALRKASPFLQIPEWPFRP